MNKLVSGAIGVEIELDGTKETILLPDVLDLDGKRIKHITVCDALTHTPTGRVIATPVGYLSIVEKNSRELKLNELPLTMLNSSVINGNMLFINKIIDFKQSFIKIVSPATYTGKSLYLVFWFDEPKTMGIVNEIGRTAIDAFEVPIPNLTNSKYLFGENRSLYGRLFQNMMLFVSASGSTPKGLTPITDTLSKKAFITLQKDNYQYFRQIPLYLFNQTALAYPLRLQNIGFDFTNSFIEFGEKTGLTTSMSVMFNVLMDDNK